MGADPDPGTAELIRQARGGDTAALSSLLGRYRDYLRRVVEARMDRRLRPRLDPSDVVQEALLDAARYFQSFAADGPLPLAHLD